MSETNTNIIRGIVSLEDYKPDMEGMINQMFLGPQGRILELLDEFNSRYGYHNRNRMFAPLKVTKNFRWKPGTYTQVKKLYETYVMRWQLRPRGIGSIFHRRQEYHHRTIRDLLCNIEKLMYERRMSGAIWSDNPQAVINDLDAFKEDINNKLIQLEASFLQHGEEVHVKCYFKVSPTERVPEIEFKRTRFILEFHWKKLDLNVRDRERKLLQTIPGHPIVIKFDISFLKLFNQYHGYGRNWKKITHTQGNQLFHTEGKCYVPAKSMAHPFIGHHSNSRDQWASVCTGDFQSGIAKSLVGGDWLGLYSLMNLWLGEYISGYTGPLNSPNYMHLGIPKGWNWKYAEQVGIRTSWCMDRVKKSSTEILSFNKNKHCDEIECQMRPTCSPFKQQKKRTKLVGEIFGFKSFEPIEKPLSNEETTKIYNEFINRTVGVSCSNAIYEIYDLITPEDWRQLVKHKKFDVITKVFSKHLDPKWWDLTAFQKKIIDNAQNSMENEMITWAVSRNAAIATPIQGDREQDFHDLVETPEIEF